MFHKKGFQISFIIMTVLSCGLPIYYMLKNIIKENDISNSVSNQYAYIFNAHSPISAFAIYFIPILAIMPFSLSYRSEKKLNYSPTVMIRTGIKKYYTTKAFACFIGSFLVFFVPLTLNIILNQIFMPETNINVIGQTLSALIREDYSGNTSYIEHYSSFPLLILFLKHPQIYNLLSIFLMSLFCGISGLFSFAISLKIRNYIYFSALPMIIILLAGYKFRELFEQGIVSGRMFVNLVMTDYCIPESLQGKNYALFALFCFIITLVSFSIVKLHAKDDQL